MTSPKDVIILIDTSGSVFGLTFSLIRVSVRHVLKSLTSNDFFNVVVFNKEASFLNPDCTGLLPAHDLYKEVSVTFDMFFKHCLLVYCDTTRGADLC